MFRGSLSNAQDVKAAATGWANGASKAGDKDSQAYNIIAIGSQDRTITVWTTASPRPLFVAKHFFTQSVVDLSWFVSSQSKCFLHYIPSIILVGIFLISTTIRCTPEILVQFFCLMLMLLG